MSDWPDSDSSRLLTIVVPTHGRIDVTLRFLETYRAQSRPSHLIFVDDRSPDDTVRVLRERGETVIEPERRLYFNGILNLAIASCRTPYLGFLNNDLVLGSRFVEDSLATFERTGFDFLVPFTFEEADLDPAELERVRRFRVLRLRRQQGWCMLFRTASVKRLPAIPDDLRLWFGDSWIFHHAWESGQKMGVMMHTAILHQRHTTIQSDATFKKTGVHPVIEEDKRVFAERYSWVTTKRLGAWRLVPRYLRRRIVPFT
ncbi:MAG: glycosyltransferase [Planctomycetota bacterium]|nr:glycosyltransferase [Planctomycetota bacterium]